MKNSSFNVDILKRRRFEEGIVNESLKPDKKIFKKGIKIGSFIFGLTLLPTFIILFQLFLFHREKVKLSDSVFEYDNLTQQNQKLGLKVNNLKTFNKDLASSISSLSSSSALLTKLSNIIPNRIKLSAIRSEDENLILEGFVDAADGLDIVNIFILQLDSSGLFQSRKVSMNKASLTELNLMQNSSNRTDMQQNYLSFEIIGKLVPNNKNFDKDTLNSLGSTGLASRLEILQNYKLLP